MRVLDGQATATPSLSRREQIAFAVFSTWVIGGLYLDGWSHQAQKPETFFTPWHGLMYSGFTTAIAWSLWDGRRARENGGRADLAVDRLTVLGVVLFGVGAVGDFLWHSVFGIEVNVEALLSPTHLTLMTGGLLLVSAPIRAARAEAGDNTRPMASFAVLHSVTACLAILAFFLQFANAFRGADAAEWVRLAGMRYFAEHNAIAGVTAALVVNALFVGAIAFVVARWRTPRFAFASMLGVVAVAVSGLTGFTHVELVLAAVLGGIAADAVVRFGRADLAPIAAPVVMWPAWTAILALATPFHWSPNVWGGMTFFAVLTGVGVRLLSGLDQSATNSPIA